MGCHVLLQGIFPNQGLNPSLLHCSRFFTMWATGEACIGVKKWKRKPLSCVQLFATPWTVESMEFSRPVYWSGEPFPPPGDLPNLGITPKSPTLQVDSSPAEPPRKPQNTGVGGLSFLQGIFLTQESNWGLLYCRWIIYQLSYQIGISNTNWLTSDFQFSPKLSEFWHMFHLGFSRLPHEAVGLL